MIIRRIRIGTGTQLIYVCVCKLEEQQASSSVFLWFTMFNIKFDINLNELNVNVCVK